MEAQSIYTTISLCLSHCPSIPLPLSLYPSVPLSLRLSLSLCVCVCVCVRSSRWRPSVSQSTPPSPSLIVSFSNLSPSAVLSRSSRQIHCIPIRDPPFGKSTDKESRQMVTMSSFGKPAFSWMCTRSTPSCAWTDSPPVAVLTRREIPMILRLVVAASLTRARMALMLLALMLLAACTAASSVRFGDQLAAMVRAADDSSAGRALRQGSDYVSFSWDAKGGAHTTVLVNTVYSRVSELY
eukprot:COSAG02_NODE_14273_length_1290_cov_34.807725_1_plen_239_part_00